MNILSSGSIIQLLFILFVLALNAVLAAAQLGLLRLRFNPLGQHWSELWPERKFLQKLVQDVDATVASIRLAMAAGMMAYGFLTIPTVQEGLAGWEWQWWGSETPVSWLLAAIICILLHFAVVEVLGRAIGLAHPVACFRVAASLLVIWEWLSRPFRIVLTGWVRLGWKVFRKEPFPRLDLLDWEAQLEEVDPEKMENGGIRYQILRNALWMRDLVVADVLLPRNQVKFFDLNESIEVNLKMARESGHTRFPLCEGDLDHCIGLVHIKDLFRFTGDLKRLDPRSIQREILRIDAEESLESAMARLLRHKMHMALVIDEFRGTEGVLTLERILEELVGDIRDEFDQEEESRIRQGEGAEMVVSGLTPIHELEVSFDLDIDNENVSTLSGLITSELGRIPEKGEILEIEGLRIEVTEVDETRVIEAKVEALPQMRQLESD